MHNEPERNLVSEAWGRRTGGALTASERRSIWADLAGTFARQLFAAILDPLRLQAQPLEPLSAPDSALARAAEDAAREQPPALLGHGYRTWIFGSALAKQARISLDPEYFYVASLLHDTGLSSVVAGQDFTLRSADVVHRVCARAASIDGAAAVRIANAVVAHATWGISAKVDAIAHFVQAGAALDLAGIQKWRLDRRDVRRVYRDYPALGAHREVAALIAREARAVPNGRMALLAGAGLARWVRSSSTDKDIAMKTGEPA